MKRIATLMVTLLFAIMALAAMPTAALASDILINEDTNWAGQERTLFENQSGSLVNYTEPFTTSGYCQGAWFPIEYKHWNNCVSSFSLTLDASECFAAYDSTTFGTQLYYKVNTGAKQTYNVSSLGTNNDKWSSFRFGHYVGGQCVWN